MPVTSFDGGSGSGVVRVGQTVRRPSRPWSRSVLDLLQHLADRGFEGAPRAVGLDEQGREVVTYVDGEAGTDLPEQRLRQDDVLVALGGLVRELHDAAATFSVHGQTWQVEPGQPVETVCHNDLTPSNTVFRDGLPVAFIDWEAAAPGPRAWDVVFAAWSWVPLRPEQHPPASSQPVALAETARRYQLLLAAYGVGPDEAFLRTGIERMRLFHAHLTARAAAGSTWEVRLARRGVLDRLSAEIAWVEEHARELVSP